MYKVAAILTMHNRKDKTLACVSSLFTTVDQCNTSVDIAVFITDDGCTDGSAEALKEAFPEINILQGDGTLFWAEGMRMAWKEALKEDFDFYLLLNDDTRLLPDAMDTLLSGHDHAQDNFNQGGVYVGPTRSETDNKLTYSGSKFISRFLNTQKRLPPNGTFQNCHLANANIMMVTAEVTDKIGILRKGYAHGMADYDYALTAGKNGIPLLVMPKYCGLCENDHVNKYELFLQKDFSKRKEYLFSPLGFDLNSYLKYVGRFFPVRYPFVLFCGGLKLFMPRVYLKLFSR